MYLSKNPSSPAQKPRIITRQEPSDRPTQRPLINRQYLQNQNKERFLNQTFKTCLCIIWQFNVTLTKSKWGWYFLVAGVIEIFFRHGLKLSILYLDSSHNLLVYFYVHFTLLSLCYSYYLYAYIPILLTYLIYLSPHLSNFNISLGLPVSGLSRDVWEIKNFSLAFRALRIQAGGR